VTVWSQWVAERSKVHRPHNSVNGNTEANEVIRTCSADAVERHQRDLIGCDPLPHRQPCRGVCREGSYSINACQNVMSRAKHSIGS